MIKDAVLFLGANNKIRHLFSEVFDYVYTIKRQCIIIIHPSILFTSHPTGHREPGVYHRTLVAQNMVHAEAIVLTTRPLFV